MIPILYAGTETSFTSNGIGRLNEIISCHVTEERNSVYECEFEYPITGKLYQRMLTMVSGYATGNLNQMGIIGVIHDDKHDIQPFDLYSVSAPINGIATFNAHHISYRLSGIAVRPFTATSAADAITQLPLKITGYNPFSFWTDKGTSGSFNLEHPDVVRNILGGSEGSFLDCFGSGEYEFDKFTVKLHQNRGNNSGVTIRYGKNMTDASRELDSSGHYNAIAPYWKGTVTDEQTGESEDVLVYLSGLYVQSSQVSGMPVVAAFDFSQEFESPPTQAQLQARALQYLSDNKPWIPDDNIKISFVQLWQTTEYENVASLQRVSLCDQVSVYYPDLGIIAESQEVTKVVYNVLLERYDEMELGKPQLSFADSIFDESRADFEAALKEAQFNAVTHSMMRAANAHATELISGGLGGHVVFNLNADGEPQEILIMDTDNMNTAVNVIRMNKNGIGFSRNGYSGPFTSAWTIDGSFNANFIVAGSISANLLSGGTLRLGGASNGNGVIRVYDGDNNPAKEIATVDCGGIRGYTNYSDSSQAFTVGFSTGVYPGIFATHGISDGRTDFNPDFMIGIARRTNGTYHVNQKSRVDFSIGTGYTGGNNPVFALCAGDSALMTINNLSSGRVVQVVGSAELDAGVIQCVQVNTNGLVVYGTKNRAVKTKDYGERLLYCYETPSPLFGDVGESVLDEDGLAYIFLDPIFAETIITTQYQVFLQKYGEGDCWIFERKPGYFIVKGTPGLSFGWELKAKQVNYDQERLDRNSKSFRTVEHEHDFGEDAVKYLEELEEGRIG